MLLVTFLAKSFPFGSTEIQMRCKIHENVKLHMTWIFTLTITLEIPDLTYDSLNFEQML